MLLELAFFKIFINILILKWCAELIGLIGFFQVFVPPHPLIKHWVSVLRNEQTPCPIFRK